MPISQAESVIKNIIREIVSECASKGQAVSETLVAFMVKAVVLDPENAFSTEKTLTREDVDKLIRLSVHRLLDSKSPSLDTIKMQVFFDMNYTARKDFLDEHRRAMESRLQPVIREITDSRARSRDELESLYRKIVSSVLLRSGLGSPTDINVVREATAALQSVFPQSELGTFLAMNKREKEKHLQELTHIVTGIRLFNKDSGKGGEGIDDLPSFLNEGIPATSQNIDSDLDRVMSLAFQYTAAVEVTSGLAKPAEDQRTRLTVKLLTEAVINCRQQEAFLRVILSDVVKAAEKVKELMDEFNKRMTHLRQTIQNKTAVPTAQVYPQFVQVAEIWSGFQDEVVLLSVLTNILNNLDGFGQTHQELFPSDLLQQWITVQEVKSDKQRMEEGKSDHVNPNDFREHVWLFPGTTKNFEKLPLQFRGFCPWMMVHFDRLLVPGNPHIGVLQYHGSYYAFSSKKAAEEFANAPDLFLRALADCARKSPELIQLLELHQQFTSIAPYSQGGSMIEKPITKADAGIQTDTHFMESNIVKSYEWNEWELRRRALKLVSK